MFPLISVIVCTYNRAGLLSRAIDSVLIQKNVNVELIVVDDCSTDETLDILKNKYSEKIKVVALKKNLGVASATNRGYECSKGNYIALLGDDDYWIDEWKLSKQISLMEKQPHLGVVGTSWYELHKDASKIEKKPLVPKSKYFLKEKFLMGGGIICGSTPLLLKEAWELVGGMDEKLPKGTDSDLFRRIMLNGYGVDVIEEPTTVVDVSHGFNRMTPVENIEAIMRALYSHFRVLGKHFRLYFIYPRALFVRARRIFLLMAKWVVFSGKKIFGW